MQEKPEFHDVDGKNRRKQNTHSRKRPAGYRRMYHERVLGLLSSKERELIKGFFDADGGQIPIITSLASGPTRTAYARYGLVKESLFKHIKNRKTDSDKIPISVPLFIWLQPSLSFMEKHLLADVWDLQQKPLGCFKSNAAIAIELGTTAENVKDMICRCHDSLRMSPIGLDENVPLRRQLR